MVSVHRRFGDGDTPQVRSTCSYGAWKMVSDVANPHAAFKLLPVSLPTQRFPQ
ncbi:hypothetical protein BV22DRAFT_1041493 [Leucogyrophana mollusca]|uniref:Uncharacterized protein n=1 Tax=Leucogyrophana mollusca TaxID=85980 RepID=A0ACB8B116_9AGAM|nr:hypothetical protein BV22DRAFT_1041493 [Leucogyrophana mollusca]